MNKIIFSGVMILVCCLFGGVEIADAETDISGQCIKMEISAGAFTVSPDDVCRAAGYGPCLEASDSFYTCTTDFCGTCSGAAAGAACNRKNWWVIPATHIDAAVVGHLICDVRGWGALPAPKNVPDDFRGSVMNATNWLLGFISMLATLVIIWGGINYLTAAGDEEKARKAKKIITYGLMGVVIAGLAYAIVTVIATVILK